MGGSADPNPLRRPGPLGGGNGGTSGGRRSGLDCPRKVRTIINGPAAGVDVGTRLSVQLDESPPYPKLLLLDPAKGAIIGSLGGFPDLDAMIECVRKGESYRALVDSVDGGRIEVTCTKL